MKHVFVSVVMPTCGRARLLGYALRSLGSQDYPRDRYEVCVVNDRPEVPIAQAIEDSGISCACSEFETAGGGRSLARNVGVQAARGDVLLFVDDDMLCPSWYISAHARRHASSKHHMVVTGIRRQIYLEVPGRGEEELRRRMQKFERVHAISRRDYHCSIWRDIYRDERPAVKVPWLCTMASNLSVTAEALHRLEGPFDVAFDSLEDTEMCLRLWNLGVEFRYAPDATNYHIEHCRSMNERRVTWLQGIAAFKAKHGLSGRLVEMFFHGQITAAELQGALEKGRLPPKGETGWRSFWFWEAVALSQARSDASRGSDR